MMSIIRNSQPGVSGYIYSYMDTVDDDDSSELHASEEHEQDVGVKIVTGHRFLGGVVGEREYCVQFVREKVGRLCG